MKAGFLKKKIKNKYKLSFSLIILKTIFSIITSVNKTKFIHFMEYRNTQFILCKPFE